MGSGFLRAALAVAWKDLRVEARTREVVYATAFFAALVVLLCAFAFTREGQSDREAVAGVLWIALALSGTLGLSRALDREREGNPLQALLLAPVPRAAIYVGKLLAIVAFMLLALACAAPLTAHLFDAALFSHPVPLVALLALGAVGFAAVGSLFAAMLLRARNREVLLGILLYPVVLPLLLAGVRGTQALLALPVDLATAWFWARLILVFDVVFITLSLWLYEPLIAVD